MPRRPRRGSVRRRRRARIRWLNRCVHALDEHRLPSSSQPLPIRAAAVPTVPAFSLRFRIRIDPESVEQRLHLLGELGREFVRDRR